MRVPCASEAGEEISSVEHSEGASSSFGASSFFTFAPTRAGGGGSGGGSGVAGGGGGERDVAVSAAAGDERALFGVPLAVAVARSPSHDGIRVPLFMRLCLYFLEQNGALRPAHLIPIPISPSPPVVIWPSLRVACENDLIR